MSFLLWQKELFTGASLLWHTRANTDLGVEKELPDGSSLSRIYPTAQDPGKKGNGLVVRVIAHRLDGGEQAKAIYPLVTNLMDCEKYPARELVSLCPERWEIEVPLDEFKTLCVVARSPGAAKLRNSSSRNFTA